MLGMVESGSECWARETEIAGNRSVPKCAREVCLRPNKNDTGR